MMRGEQDDGALHMGHWNRIHWIRIPDPDSMWSRVNCTRHADYSHCTARPISLTLHAISRSTVTQHSNPGTARNSDPDRGRVEAWSGLCIRIPDAHRIRIQVKVPFGRPRCPPRPPARPGGALPLKGGTGMCRGHEPLFSGQLTLMCPPFSTFGKKIKLFGQNVGPQDAKFVNFLSQDPSFFKKTRSLNPTLETRAAHTHREKLNAPSPTPPGLRARQTPEPLDHSNRKSITWCLIMSQAVWVQLGRKCNNASCRPYKNITHWESTTRCATLYQSGAFPLACSEQIFTKECIIIRAWFSYTRLTRDI